MLSFINTELKSDSDSDSSDSDLDDNELMTKFKKSSSDSDKVISLTLNKWKKISYLTLNKNKLNTKLFWEKPDT